MFVDRYFPRNLINISRLQSPEPAGTGVASTLRDAKFESAKVVPRGVKFASSSTCSILLMLTIYYFRLPSCLFENTKKEERRSMFGYAQEVQRGEEVQVFGGTN